MAHADTEHREHTGGGQPAASCCWVVPATRGGFGFTARPFRRTREAKRAHGRWPRAPPAAGPGRLATPMAHGWLARLFHCGYHPAVPLDETSPGPARPVRTVSRWKAAAAARTSRDTCMIAALAGLATAMSEPSAIARSCPRLPSRPHHRLARSLFITTGDVQSAYVTAWPCIDRSVTS